MSFAKAIPIADLPPLPPVPKNRSFIIFDYPNFVSDDELKKWVLTINKKYEYNNPDKKSTYPYLIRQVSGPGINGDTNDWGALRFTMIKEFNRIKNSNESFESKTKKINTIIDRLEDFTFHHLKDKKTFLIRYYLLVEECKNYLKQSKL